MHIGSSSELVITSPDAPIDVLISLTPMNIVQAAADLIWSPVFRKFPDLKVALSEGGIGWIPYFLERIDYQYQQHHLLDRPGLRRPAARARSSTSTSSPASSTTHFGVASRELLNMDNVTWECDYPHSDSTWPTAPEALWKSLGRACRTTTSTKVTHLNAMRHFSYDPFSASPQGRGHGGGAASQGRGPRRVDPVTGAGHRGLLGHTGHGAPRPQLRGTGATRSATGPEPPQQSAGGAAPKQRRPRQVV